MSRKNVVVMIPTYNERENIEPLISEILKLNNEYFITVLVADDNSPDGTGKVVLELSRVNPRIKALIRKKRRGRGTGGIDGFKAALKLRPDYIIEMDGDFSHRPQDIPLLLPDMKKADIVIGSRYVPGGKDTERSLLRRMVTFLVRFYIRKHFRLPVKDASSGFRCFRKEVLEKIDLDDLISIGPSIVLEILYKAYLMGFTFKEVPITFVDRTKGKTKLTPTILLETFVMSLIIKQRLSKSFIPPS